MVLLSLFLALALAPAHAEDCKSIPKALKDASPHDAARLYTTLAQCDAPAAKKAAGSVLPSLIGDEGGREAAIAAIRVGAGAAAQAWIGELQSDDRAPLIRQLGKLCGEDTAIQGFLGQATDLGDDFWAHRWYRALVDCRVPAMQKILSDHVDAAVGGEDRVRYFAVVSAWAANIGAEAVPKLEKMIAETDEIEIQVNLLQAFTDAAQVGTTGGTDPKVAEASVAAINRLAVDLPFKAVEQARLTLQALDDAQSADALARVRYNAVLQDDGTLLYGVVAVETASCKNGKVQQYAHIAEVADQGQTWPDQLEEKLSTVLEHSWKMNLAERCKGEGEAKLYVPSAPFENRGAFNDWVADQLKAAKKAEVKKIIRKDHDKLAL
jgi:hypothetical protein